MTARELSKLRGMRGTEEAFTCGLLHESETYFLSNDVEGYTSLLEQTEENEML